MHARGVLAQHGAKLSGKASAFNENLIRHMLYAAEQGGFVKNGIYGGHHTAELLRFADDNPTISIQQVKVKSVGGTTFREYRQYKWKDSSRPKPKPGSGKAPGESNFNPSEWDASVHPKTTFDDPAVMLHEAESGWGQYLAAHKPTVDFVTFTSPSGIKIGAYVDVTMTPPHPRTLFVEASWL